MTRILAISFAIGLGFGAAACGGSNADESTTPPSTEATGNTAPATPAAEPAAPAGDIVAVAQAAGSFNTLLAAAEAAGLVEALRADGPLTVFAPTDEAFAKLPEGTVEALLQDKEKLTAILTYHVVSGKVTSDQVAGLDSAMTLSGKSLAIDTSSGVKVGDATVIKADIPASNGVIHVIDTVLIPE